MSHPVSSSAVFNPKRVRFDRGNSTMVIAHLNLPSCVEREAVHILWHRAVRLISDQGTPAAAARNPPHSPSAPADALHRDRCDTRLAYRGVSVCQKSYHWPPNNP